MNKILIDFPGGAHGHFLESILNGLDSESTDLINDSPFRLSDRGTCRNKIYNPWSLRFCSDHYYNSDRLKKHQLMIDAAEHCITIKFHPDYRDIMHYLRVTFSRGLPPDRPQPGAVGQLHNNFYHKTSSPEFLKLRYFAIELGSKVSQSCPDVEIHILRNMLAQRMLAPDGDLLAGIRNRVPFYREKTQHVFMFSWFYDQSKFMEGISELSTKFNLNLQGRQQRVQELHQQFLSMNEFVNDSSYQKCQHILDNIESREPMPELDILEQAWILSRLQTLSGRKIIYNNDEFFKTPHELYQYITLL